MRLLVRTAFRYSRHYLLLIVALLFMMGVTLSAQAEMLSFGVITNAGADFFSLFSSKGEEGAESISLTQVEERWSQIAGESGAITKRDAASYLSTQKSRNPLNNLMRWFAGRIDWLSNLALLALVLLVVAIFRGICVFGSSYTQQLVMIRVSRDLRQHYFEHIQALPMRFYHKHNIGSLSCRAYEDAYQIAEAIQAGMVTYIQTPFAVLSSLLICLYMSFQLSLVVFIAFPILILPIVYFSKRVKRVQRRLLKNHEGIWSLLHQFLGGIQTIKIFGMERFSLSRYTKQNGEMAALEERAARYGYMARPVLHAASTALLAAIILYGLYVARLSVSEILVFCGMVYVMYEPIKRFNDENIKIQRGMAAAERMFEVLDLKITDRDQEGALPLAGLCEQIEFDRVSFRYGEEWVLQEVSFSIRKGEAVALIGPTGAGKSTLAQLLPRLYEVTEGEIRIDGKSISAYQLGALRRQISYVPQKPFLFVDSIGENIAVGRPVSLAQIERAAKRAHADEFIERLPQGYSTYLSTDMGGSLSGGQQQRLAIARALVQEAPILIMDEATSALDTVSEDRIKQAVRELKGEVTQIIIAHRLSTIEYVDRIIYLEGGRLVAQGTKEELLATCPGFRLMWEMGQLKS